MAGKYLKFLKKRTVWLLVIFLVLYGMIAGRLFYIQVLNNSCYTKLAEKLRHRVLTIPASRGGIYDRVGRQLATNIPACSVYIRPQDIKKDEDKKKVAVQLAGILGVEESAIWEKLASGKSFMYLKRQLPSSIGDKIRAANLLGVGIDRETKRIYPSKALAAHILGFTSIDGGGVEGIESAKNTYLSGKDGYTEAEVDRRGRIIPETRRQSVQSVDGNDVVLTIDAYLQHVAEEALAKSFKKYSAAGATAIVLDPHTGEILALATCPSFDPNNRKGISSDVWRNRAVTDLYEPGSTMKLVTVAAGVQEGISPTAPVTTCTKSGMPLGKNKVRCTLHAPYQAGHGAVNMFGIIRDSCNIGAATVALKIGPDKFYSYVKGFGLLDPPGTGFRGESCWRLEPPDTWAAIRLANIGFGQGIAVSAMHMATAYSVIANGGNLVRPQIIREIRDSSGKVVKPFSPAIERRVVSEETSRTVIEMLMGCVDEGTGKTARVEGYTVAGKTGSAQKASTTGRGYAAGKFVASFIGFVPAKDPRLVICVVIDEPKGSHWGATCAGPVFQEIAQKATLYLRIPPDAPKEEQTLPKGALSRSAKVHHKLGAGHTG